MWLRARATNAKHSMILIFAMTSSVLVLVQMFNYSFHTRKRHVALPPDITRRGMKLNLVDVHSNESAENLLKEDREYLMNMYLLHPGSNDSWLIQSESGNVGINKDTTTSADGTDLDNGNGDDGTRTAQENTAPAPNRVQTSPKPEIVPYFTYIAPRNHTENKTSPLLNPEEACPFINYSTVCRVSVEANPGPTEGGDPGTRPGFIHVNDEHLFQWTVAPALAVVRIDDECRLLETVVFENATSRGIGSDGAEWTDFGVYYKSLPLWSRLICVFYGRSHHFKKLVDIGVDSQSLHNVEHRTGMVTLTTIKGYQGHVHYKLTPRGKTVNTLQFVFFKGQPFEVVKYYHTYSMVLASHVAQFQPGGFWTPSDCKPRWRIAIIIPYRRRNEHLYLFMENMLRFLQRQRIAFNIFVIEQADPELFNRASLMNIGFLEARKLTNFDCYAFQDVDLVPEDLTNMYACTKQPRHLVVTRSATDYKVARHNYFGGGILMTPELIERINGFPNRMFGWGGEDDDIFARVNSTGAEILRYPPEIGRYASLHHRQDYGNPNMERKLAGIYRQVARRGVGFDGLNTTVYTLIAAERRPIYTHIFVRIPGPKSRMEALIEERGDQAVPDLR